MVYYLKFLRVLILLYLLTLTDGGLFSHVFLILDYELTFSGASGSELCAV